MNAPEPQGGDLEPREDDHNLNNAVASDADMAATIASALSGFRWAGGLGWRRYDEQLGIWAAVPEEAVAECVRRLILDAVATHLESAAELTRNARNADFYTGLAAAWRKYASASRIFAITRLVRGILLTDPSRFDAHPDLLNCPNGVINLRTGARDEHDPALLFTQVAGARYVPGARHPDIETALQAIPADVLDYAQLRYGQGATGWKPPDDVIDVQHGSGANGKSTILAAIGKALGDYAAVLPARLLLASPDAHTTELMTLRGVRVGIIEELPEEHHLSVTRIKIATASKITARLIRQDNVTFDNACTLIISTNYRPQVHETDHGTWRRLEGSIPFPYTYRKPHERLRDANDRRGDGTLRERIETDGGERAEAMLAWLAEGARRWYAGDDDRPPMTMGEPPSRVQDDVTEWRESCDVLFSYITSQLAFDPGAHVISEELLTEFNRWLQGRGPHQRWGMELFEARFGGHSECREHGVTKIRPRAGREPGLSRPPVATGSAHPDPKPRYTAWRGVRFEISQNEETAGGSGWSGPLVNPYTRAEYLGFASPPDHPDPRSFSDHWAAMYRNADHDVPDGWLNG